MLIIIQFLIILTIGIVSHLITKNVFIGIIITFTTSLMLKRIPFKKTSISSVKSGFISSNTIYDFLFKVVDDAEQGKTSLGVLDEIVDNMNLIDEQGVEWKVDPLTLELYNSKEKIQPFDPVRNFKVKFNGL